MWEDGECWIIGGGSSILQQFGIPEPLIRDVLCKAISVSAYSDYLEPIHGKHVIGVNNAYLIGPWIDILFFGDCSWYLMHRKRIAQWPGVKISCCPRFSNNPRPSEHIKFLQKDPHKKLGISTDRTTVSWNFNSGGAAISLAAHLGVKIIYLLGFDMQFIKERTHWHGPHRDTPKKPRTSPPFARHLRGFPKIAQDAKRMRIKIYNVSPDSAINDFTKKSLKEVL